MFYNMIYNSFKEQLMNVIVNYLCYIYLVINK